MTHSDDSANRALTPAEPPRAKSLAWLVRRRKLLVLAALSLAVCLVVARFAAIQGLFVPVRVAGDSMAETLVGEHLRVACADCRYAFRCGVEGLLESETAVCPNCGFAENSTAGRVVHPGQRVWIDRFAYVARGPSRGDLVALRDPLDSSRLVVKRVVGLPGEWIELRRGDVYRDDLRWQKSLAELRAVASPVHDERFQPERSPNLPPRWAPRGDWETYQHWRCFASPLPRSELSPVLDNDPYNQSVSRQLREAVDQLFVARLDLAASDRAVVAVRLVDGHAAIVCDGPSRCVSLWRSAGDELPEPREIDRWQKLAESPPLPALGAAPCDVEIAICDGRCLVAIEGEQCMSYDATPNGEPWQVTSSTPWSTAILGTNSQFTARRILRDVYYLDPLDRQDNWRAERRLGADEYFLLGDNPSVSIDSRHWPNGGAARRSQMVGRVIH